MHTFRRRLTIALAGCSAVFLSLFCVVLFFWCRAAFLSDLDGDLEAIYRAGFKSGSNLGNSKWSELPEETDEAHVIRMLLAPDGTLVQPTDRTVVPKLNWSAAMLQSILSRGSIHADVEFRDNFYRTLSNPVRVGSSTFIEVLGISREPMEHSLRELKRFLLLSLLVGIAVVAVVSCRVATYLTNPLEEVVGQLETVTASGEPALRLSGSYRDLEMISLRDQVNAMLERLEASFQSQRQFISNASHELRAPLANLTVALEVCLRRQRDAAEYRQTLETCWGETRRLTALSQQLLQLSKADEGALTVRTEPVCLSDLSRQCLERHSASAQLKGVGLEQSGVAINLSADPLKISQILDNLVDNAVRYSPEGSSVMLRSAIDSGYAVLSVSDQGSGMTAEQLDHVFDRFYRADPSRQRHTGGAGLGLAISRAIAEAHGGSLNAESAPGHGTTFLLRLPVSL